MVKSHKVRIISIIRTKGEQHERINDRTDEKQGLVL